MLPCAGLGPPLSHSSCGLLLSVPSVPWTSNLSLQQGLCPHPYCISNCPVDSSTQVTQFRLPISQSELIFSSPTNWVIPLSPLGCESSPPSPPHGTQSPSPVPSNFQELLQPVPSSLLQFPPPWFRPPSSLTWTSRKGPGLAPSLSFTTLL